MITTDHDVDLILTMNPTLYYHQFKTILNEIQGKEQYLVPAWVIEHLQQKMVEDQISPTDLTYNRVRQYIMSTSDLMQLNHIMLIIKLLGGPVLFQLTQQTEVTLCDIARQRINKLSRYIATYPTGITSFITPRFMLCKLCEELDINEFIPFTSFGWGFKPNQEIMKQIDDIWNTIR